MVDYTSLFRIRKPTVGADADAWGGYLNTGLDGIDALLGAITTGGSANAYTLTTGQSLSAYASGQRFCIRASFSNSGAATINVDGLGAKNLTKNGATAVASGDIVSGSFYLIAYDGTQFQILGASSGLYQPLDATLTALAALTITAQSLIVGTGADAFSVLASGTTGQVLQTGVSGLSWATPASLPKGFLFGCGLAYNTTDRIDLAAGKVRDSTDAADITVSALTAGILGSTWVAGNTQNKLDTGSPSNTTYFVFVIKKDSDGSSDMLFSASATSPTMPTGYTYFRRVGAIVRSGGNIRNFVQDGDWFRWAAPVSDVSGAIAGTTAVTTTLSLPVGIRIQAHISTSIELISIPAASIFGLYTDLSQTDTTPSATAWNVWIRTDGADGTANGTSELMIMTNTSAQIRRRYNSASGGPAEKIITHGWQDRRGRDA